MELGVSSAAIWEAEGGVFNLLALDVGGDYWGFVVRARKKFQVARTASGLRCSWRHSLGLFQYNQQNPVLLASGVVVCVI